MQKLKRLEEIENLRKRNAVVETFQVKKKREFLSNDYDFSSENSRLRSEGEKWI